MLDLFKKNGEIHQTVVEILMYDSFDYYNENVARYYIRVHYLNEKKFKGVWVDLKTLNSINGFFVMADKIA